jgi:tetratricopeptide (TPR) repeat protein
VSQALILLRIGDVNFKRQQSSGLYRDAEAARLQALSILKALDLQFWVGLVNVALSDIYISRGDLVEAGEALAVGRRILETFDLAAPTASLLISTGWLEMYRGNYDKALADLIQAEELIEQVGNQAMLGICDMHLGELYLEMGRYQLSLRYLERALVNCQIKDSTGRMAECGLRLSRCWRALGLPDRALEALDGVEINATQARQGDIFPYLHIRRAESLFDQVRIDEAVDSLRKALTAAGEFEDRTGLGLAHRLLGEMLINIGQMGEVAENLEAAENIALDVGLIVERAACQVAWGNYYRKLGDDAAARMAWRIAAEIGQNLAPDIVWQAKAGLADLAEESGDLAAALEHYRLVVDAVVRLRQDMWQPALAGFFLKRPIATLDSAIRLAVSAGTAQDVLNFIEASKAQVMAKLFTGSVSAESGVYPADLANLAAEIRWRQGQVRVVYEGASLNRLANYRKLRKEIRELVKEYDSLRSWVERQNQSTVYDGLVGMEAEFDLERFRKAANEQFGKDWVALDYYEL